MADPIPFTLDGSGPEGAIPVSISGIGSAVAAAVEDAKGVDIAPIYALPRGGRTVLLGDSLFATNEQYGATITHQNSSANHMALSSGGRLWYPANAGVGGNTAAQMLARFDSDVLAYAPDICVIGAGTNDSRVGVTLAAFKESITSIVAKCVAAGIFPALRTVPPCYDPAGLGGEVAVRGRIATYNAWIKEWAPTVGVPVIDVFTEFVNPANGRIRAPYRYGDDIHFTAEGYAKQGQMIAAVLAPFLGAALPYVASDAGDPTDLLGGNGLFLGAPAANGLPAGWSTGDASHTTFSVADAPDGFGKELSITALGSAAYQVQAYRYVSTGIAAGDVVEVSGILSATAASGHTPAVQIALQGTPASPATINRQVPGFTLTGGTFCERFTVPSGTVGGLLLRLYAGPSAGTSRFRRLRVRNLSALGVASV